MKACKEAIFLGILGKKWMPHIIATFGEKKQFSFGDLQREFPYVTPRLLSQRLKELGSLGLIEHHSNNGLYKVSERFEKIDELLKELGKAESL